MLHSPRFLRHAGAAALGVLLLLPFAAQAQYCRPPFGSPGTYLGNNIYVRQGIGTVSYYYWTGVPGSVPVLIRTQQVGQTITTVTPTLPLVPGLPPTTVVQNTTTTQTTVVQTPIMPLYPSPILNPLIPRYRPFVPPGIAVPPRPIVPPIVIAPRPLFRR